MQYRTRQSLCVMASLVVAGLAQAGPDWVEGDHGVDAGALLSGAQVTKGSSTLLRISGTLSTGTALVGSQVFDLQDMYLIRIDDPLAFCATTVMSNLAGGSADFDSKLWLFNASGLGLLGNDDTAVVPLLIGTSTVSGSTLGPFACDETESSIPAPGLYYLAISKAHLPLSNAGPIFNFDDQDLCGPGELSGPDGVGAGQPISGWIDNQIDFDIQVQGGRAGNYSKAFTLAGNPTLNPQVFSNIGVLADNSGYNDWKLGWNFGSDNDPTEGQASLGSGFTIENTMPDVSDPAANHLRFSINLRMKLKVPSAASVLGGNAAITLLTRPSLSSNAGQVTSDSQPVWNATLNSADAASLFSPSFQLSSPATPFTGSTAVTNATLPQFASSDEVESIGVRMVFDLTPGEKASFIGAFSLLPMAPLPPHDGGTVGYTIFLCGVSPAIPVLAMPLDIKHGHCPNLFRPGSNGILNVTLVGTSAVDVHDVVVSSVRLSRTDDIGGEVAPNEGPPGPHSSYHDKATPFPGTPCNCHSLNGDGITDLWMKFQSHLLADVLELDDLPCGQFVELRVTGQFTDNTEFVARDCIQIAHADDSGCNDGNLAGMGGKVNVRCAISNTWIDASTSDAFIDDGGFSHFERYYQSGTAVTLSAPPISGGQMFKGWRIDGKSMVNKANLTITTDKKPHTYEAVYVPVTTNIR